MGPRKDMFRAPGRDLRAQQLAMAAGEPVPEREACPAVEWGGVVWRCRCRWWAGTVQR